MDLQGEEPRAIFELVNVYGVKQKAEIPVTDWAGGVKVLREKCLRIDESPSQCSRLHASGLRHAGKFGAAPYAC